MLQDGRLYWYEWDETKIKIPKTRKNPSKSRKRKNPAPLVQHRPRTTYSNWTDATLVKKAREARDKAKKSRSKKDIDQYQRYFSAILTRVNIPRLQQRIGSKYFGGDFHRSDDVISLTFEKVHTKLGQYRGGSALDTWVSRIAENVAKDQLKSVEERTTRRAVQLDASGPRAEQSTARVERILSEQATVYPVFGYVPSTEAAATANQNRRVLKDYLSTLQRIDPEAFQVLVAHIVSDTDRAAARSLGMAKGTFSTKLKEARKHQARRAAYIVQKGYQRQAQRRGIATGRLFGPAERSNPAQGPSDEILYAYFYQNARVRSNPSGWPGSAKPDKRGMVTIRPKIGNARPRMRLPVDHPLVVAADALKKERETLGSRAKRRTKATAKKRKATVKKRQIQQQYEIPDDFDPMDF